MIEIGHDLRFLIDSIIYPLLVGPMAVLLFLMVKYPDIDNVPITRRRLYVWIASVVVFIYITEIIAYFMGGQQ
ncbi:MAG: hypothetical protein ABF477_03815 [Leuconostoc pseudomesenteroides]|uniref:hypothetical protein n=1 Tax=Leuconostoc pseudomesenteroides TaxID=33968 RepID=UPI0039EB7D1F